MQKSQAQKNLRGVIAMMLAMWFFVMNDALVKLARLHWETGQILVIRGLFAVAFIGLWLTFSGGWKPVQKAGRGMVLARATLEAFIATAFITALGMMALADITAVLMLAPLLITAISMIFFGEKIGWRRWLAVIVGFFGMLLVVRPGGDVSGMALLLAFGAVMGVAWRDIMTRQIPQGISGGIITLTSTLGTLSGGLVLTAFGMVWRPFTSEILMLLAGAAMMVALGNYAIIVACRDVDLSVVSPFRYSIIIWALLLGAVLFDEMPNLIAGFGLILIAGSGIYTIHRERARQKMAAKVAMP